MKKFAALMLSLIMIGTVTTGCTLPGIMPKSSSEVNSTSSNSSKEIVSSEKPQVDSSPLSESEIKELYTDPDRFTGRTVSLVGKVFSQPEKDQSGIYFQMFSDAENNEGNTIVAYMDPDFEVEDGDYVKLTGIVQGKFEGSNAYGGTITAAQILATTVEKSSYVDVVSPALKTLTSDNTTLTQHGYSVSLTKIEFAEQETRLYVTVTNGGKDKFNLYSFNAKIVQDGKQYEEQTNYDADYPEVQTDLLPGTTTEGIIVFPKLEQKSLQVVLEASSEDYHEDFEPYSFDISIE